MKLSNINNVTGCSDSSGDFKIFLKNFFKKGFKFSAYVIMKNKKAPMFILKVSQVSCRCKVGLPNLKSRAETSMGC